ncbi:ATPase, T2SS/T4P/T4SS family [Persephonella sp.]
MVEMQEFQGTPREFLERIFNMDFNDAYILPDEPIRIIKGFEHSQLPFIVRPEFIRNLIAFLKEKGGGLTDFAFREDEINLRIHLVRIGQSKEYNGLIVRKLFSFIPDPDTLKIPQPVVDIFKKVALSGEGGIILINGKQRQGKSTTMASLLNVYNIEESGTIITIENPIEYLIEPIQSIIIQKDIVSYATDTDATTDEVIAKATRQALIDAMREFPSIIAIGEIRTGFEVEMAVKLAESGVLVIASFHGETIPSALSRFMNMLAEQTKSEQSITTFLALLKAVIGQRLLPNKDDASKMELVAEYYIPSFTPENVQLISLLKQRKIQDFFLRFAKSSSTYAKSLSVALQEAVAKGRIDRATAEAADGYKKLLMAMRD